MSDNSGKTPTWQVVAMGAISLLLVFASILMNETRSDIREVRVQISQLTPRMSAIEASQAVQYSATMERQADIKNLLSRIAEDQKAYTDKFTKHLTGNK